MPKKYSNENFISYRLPPRPVTTEFLWPRRFSNLINHRHRKGDIERPGHPLLNPAKEEEIPKGSTGFPTPAVCTRCAYFQNDIDIRKEGFLAKFSALIGRRGSRDTCPPVETQLPCPKVQKQAFQLALRMTTKAILILDDLRTLRGIPSIDNGQKGRILFVWQTDI